MFDWRNTIRSLSSLVNLPELFRGRVIAAPGAPPFDPVCSTGVSGRSATNNGERG
jgi:hypothetical protein